MGFVVGERHIITCAHVVNVALEREQRAQEKPEPNVRVQIDFPTLGGPGAPPPRSCQVAAWIPPPVSGATGGDVAGLEVIGDALPSGAGPARLIDAASVGDTEATMFGHPREPAPRPAGAWAVCRLRGEVPDGMLQLDADREAAFRAQPGYSGSPVVVADDGGDAVVGMLAVASWHEGARDAYAISKAGLEAAWPEVLMPLPACPYRGLEPFRAEDAEAKLFVGRSDETDLLREMVEKHALVVVVGASGVGKSSLVIAGLLPALRPEEWVTATFRPGEKPFLALAEALYNLEGSDHELSKAALAERIRDGGLAPLMGELRLPTNKRILLYIDQFEEIFTISPKERSRFFDQVFLSVDDDDAACRLVCTLRADFWPQLLDHPGVGRRVHDRLLSLSPMDTATLERAVTEPARVRGVTFDDKLAQRIARDTAGGNGGLPLMEFALTELWPKQLRGRLTFAAYEEIGGVEGALNRHAEKVFAELEQQGLGDRVQRIMLTLVRNREGAAEATRCVVQRDRLDPADWAVVEKLAHHRLLVIGNR